MRTLIRWAARLYPPSWRNRYAAEFDALLDDISPSFGDVCDVLGDVLRVRATTSIDACLILHPILKKLALEQGGLNIFRRFRITAMETAEVPQALQHTWSGHARTHVSEVYKKLLKQREWRLGWAERAGMGFSLPERKNPRNAQLAQLIEFRRVG
jgi:hypothetical protein